MDPVYLSWSKLPLKAQQGVVVGCDQTQEWLLPWWWHHYQSSNRCPVTFIDFGITQDAQQWCQERGALRRLPLPDIYVKEKEEVSAHLAQEWESIYGREFWSQRNGWFKKPLACLLSPYQQSIWIDLDCEVRGDLSKLFPFCEHPSGIALAKDIHDPLGGKQGYNSGVIVYQHGIELIERWAREAIVSNHLHAGDQDILTALILKQNLSIAELPLIYNWSRCSGDNSEAKIFHWHGRHGKTVIAASLQQLFN